MSPAKTGTSSSGGKRGRGRPPTKKSDPKKEEDVDEAGGGDSGSGVKRGRGRPSKNAAPKDEEDVVELDDNSDDDLKVIDSEADVIVDVPLPTAPTSMRAVRKVMVVPKGTGSLAQGQGDQHQLVPSQQRPRSKFNYHRFVRQLTWSRIKEGIIQFWKDVPHFLWTFFIDSFVIPAYRPEWAKYSTWQPRPADDPLKLNPKERKADKRKTNKERRKLMSRIVASGPPKPVKHNHALCEILTINVAGRIFQTQLRTLLLFPNTLLGDPARLVQFYDPTHGDYFIDRNRTTFEAVLYFYQSRGILRRPSTIGMDVFEEEIRFYDLGQEVIEKLRREEGILLDVSKPVPKRLFQRKLWLLFEYPESSRQAKIVAVLSILVVIISIFIFCLETLSDYERDRIEVPEGLQGADAYRTDEQSMSDPFFFTETICIFWFVFEFVVRVATAPGKVTFFKEISNIIDLLAILPYFATVFMNSNTDDNSKHHNKSSSLTIFRVVRLVRVFRILKLSRHNRGLKVLGKTLRASIRELGLLMFFLGIGVVLFSSAVYFADLSDPETHFSSIIDAFWWSVITMTTCGYGDAVPVTVLGKLVGALCAIAGVLTLALPVPVIVSNFNNFYNREDDIIVNSVECDHVYQCPFRNATYALEDCAETDGETNSKGVVRYPTGGANAAILGAESRPAEGIQNPPAKIGSEKETKKPASGGGDPKEIQNGPRKSKNRKGTSVSIAPNTKNP